MDVIAIRGMRVYGRHGADPGERDEPQPLEIDVELDLDLEAAARSDDLDRTVDYAALHARIVAIVEERSYALIERVAGAIMEEVFRDARVAAARVQVAKPRLLDGATPSVRLSRSR